MTPSQTHILVNYGKNVVSVKRFKRIKGVRVTFIVILQHNNMIV